MCERNINRLPLTPMPQPRMGPKTQGCALTGNQTGDLTVCEMMLSQLSHTSQDTHCHFFLYYFEFHFSLFFCHGHAIYIVFIPSTLVGNSLLCLYQEPSCLLSPFWFCFIYQTQGKVPVSCSPSSVFFPTLLCSLVGEMKAHLLLGCMPVCACDYQYTHQHSCQKQPFLPPSDGGEDGHSLGDTHSNAEHLSTVDKYALEKNSCNRVYTGRT